MGFTGRTNATALLLASTIAMIGCGGGSSSKKGSTVAPVTSAAPVTSGTTGGTTSSSGGAVNTATTALGQGPQLNTVAFEDTDGDQRVSKGDTLIATFVRDVEPVPASADPAVEFELAVQGDSFGVNATLQNGPAANQVSIVLGDEPVLYVSGSFNDAQRTKGAASGINVATSAGQINGTNAGAVQAATAFLDVSGTLTAKFHAGGSLNVPRGAHASVRLDDGRILIVGGVSGAKKDDLVVEAELYDPLTESFTKVTDMSGDAGYMKRGKVKVGFFSGSAIKLKNGDVLICGGYGVERKTFFGLGKTKVDTLESAFLFHPLTNTFERVGDLTTPRHSHTASLLADGRVLIGGGYNESLWKTSKTHAPLEVYDPGNKRFSKLGKIFRRVKLQTPRMAHAATTINNGTEVLFSGGAYYKGGGLFGLIKPKLFAAKGSEVATATGTESKGDMVETRVNHATVEFAPDKVMAVGGHSLAGGAVGTVEVYNTNTGDWTRAGSLRAPRSNAQVAFVRNEALVIGGHTGQAETATVEVFQRDAGRMSTTTYDLATARNACSVNVLDDGRVVVIGGLVGGQRSWLSIDGAPIGSVEIFVSN